MSAGAEMAVRVSKRAGTEARLDEGQTISGGERLWRQKPGGCAGEEPVESWLRPRLAFRIGCPTKQRRCQSNGGLLAAGRFTNRPQVCQPAPHHTTTRLRGRGYLEEHPRPTDVIVHRARKLDP